MENLEDKKSNPNFGKSIDLSELKYQSPNDATAGGNSGEDGGEEPLTRKASDSFRDSVGNIDSKGNRIWIYPTKPKGDFYDKRTIVSIVLLAILFINPFISVNGHPFFLFDIFNRTFVLFGVLFYPQDFHLFAMALLAIIFFIVLFTAVFGRIWCGWACPQTIFMEMVFRKIEYWIDGNASEQKVLDKQPMNSQKLGKRVAKYSIFYAISFIIANLLFAYVVGVEKLSVLVTDGPMANSELFLGVMIFSFVFFGVFAWFREQACIYVCPYGRLQSVLLDSNSIVVAYDYIRGEKREKYKKKRSEDAGDCIDCHKCVDVCPTGIDIRNGTQLECINCTACIDACDKVMEQIGKPKKLIKFASLDQIEQGNKFKFTNRLKFYTVLLSVLLLSLVFLLSNRTEVEATILRAKGILFNIDGNGNVNNLFTMKIFNKTYKDINFTMKTSNIDSKIEIIGGKKQLIKAGEMFDATFIMTINKQLLKENKNEVTLEIKDQNGKVIENSKTIFMAPDNERHFDKYNEEKHREEKQDNDKHNDDKDDKKHN